MWFTADLFFESVLEGTPQDEAVWEQQIVLIGADCEEEAMRRARALGKEREVEYISAGGGRVRWVFRDVESVFEVLDESLEFGTELFARFLRAEEARALLTSVGGQSGVGKR